MSQNKTGELLLPRRGFVDCFGCSPRNPKGLKLRIWYTKKGCTSYYTIPKEYCGFKGLVHGGIIATLLDEVSAWTIITHFFRVGVTVEAKIKYLKPVPTQIEIDIIGEIINSNKERITVLTKIQSKEGNVLAEAESKWLLPNPKILQKITGLDASEINQLSRKIIQPIQEIVKGSDLN
jgi:uncharacterized protein (TIGR00369 family)